MKVELTMEARNVEDKSDYFLKKELEMDVIPDIGEEICEELNEDDEKAIFLKVIKRTFYLRGYVHITLEHCSINNEKLKRLKEFGWI
ncbi:hypothetical protein [Methanobacterium sp.]|uniref:hypothetical protein n=1 Tax=Methanobacterium sp. TaxID=2164 RepID=UPI0031591F6B